MSEETFKVWIERWGLTPDGEPFASLGGQLLPVRRDGVAAMLKVSHAPEEIAGGTLMAWWDGKGAAPVLAHDGEALLMVRARGAGSLAQMATTGQDDEASRIICAGLDGLHAPRAGKLPSTLRPLPDWFAQLGPAAQRHGGVLAKSYDMSRKLLADPRQVCVLHGDAHHGNFLDFGALGWLAIDPKGLIGDRGYDYANLLCNPDLATAVRPGRIARQVRVVADAARLEPLRTLQWLLAYAGLSASWTLSDGNNPAGALQIAEIAAAELGF
ncbi:aminoglycoside phosphotransferase family protein [Phenylobacterium sp.]|uniref:aminoglycoside phosphotransferase family protein n=1 Tax=Phenylobacterium sp. TaxID=1871053 RepID=UPI00271E0E48|nr:aminoglycoside phosphotransferase family protein [Phenylobacterium sp.]MDO8799601.1 aminoglycoside phosphotransferase family protein [Phenylobacterium sp.]